MADADEDSVDLLSQPSAWFSQLYRSGESMLEAFRATATSPLAEKALEPVGAERAAKLANISRTTLSKMVDRGDIEPSISYDAAGRPLRRYDLATINRIRDLQGTRPGRPPGARSLVVSFANLKGGSSKTTSSLHFAQALALRGYRTLFIDMDPQASATVYFGIVPDMDLGDYDTIGPALRGDEADLGYAVRSTYWDGLDAVYANLTLVDSELQLLQAKVADSVRDPIERLWRTLDPIRDNYDVVVIDAPPAFGLLAMNVICAADHLVVPIRPNILDFASSVQYWKILAWLAENTHLRMEDMRVLISQYQRNSRDSVQAARLLRRHLGDMVLQQPQETQRELDNAGRLLQTVFEVLRPSGSRETQRKAWDNFFAVADELLEDLHAHWNDQVEEADPEVDHA